MITEIAKPPTSLYTCENLSKGFDDSDTQSAIRTFSFEQYCLYRPLQEKGATDSKKMQEIALHDAKVSELLLNYLYESKTEIKRIVGVMGGHAEKRSGQTYQDMANLCRELTKKGFIVVTGGGPGMMEAAHIGSYFANCDDASWQEVIKELSSLKDTEVDSVPKDQIVDTDGKILEGTEKAISKIHSWYKTAKQIKNKCHATPGDSIAISTWEYGQEPVMPFATIYAAYFQNSIRESALVRESRCGVIYGKGGGGTMREIWQDLEENYYTNNRDAFTPMIFFDRDSIWGSSNSNGSKPLDVFMTAFNCLNYRLSSKGFSWEDKVTSTFNSDKIISILSFHMPAVQKNFITRFIN